MPNTLGVVLEDGTARTAPILGRPRAFRPMRVSGSMMVWVLYPVMVWMIAITAGQILYFLANIGDGIPSPLDLFFWAIGLVIGVAAGFALSFVLARRPLAAIVRPALVWIGVSLAVTVLFAVQDDPRELSEWAMLIEFPLAPAVGILVGVLAHRRPWHTPNKGIEQNARR